MHIDFIEVANFRKLLATRIDIAKESTVFVGANNSGKTSAMVALRRFLLDQRDFTINDFTLSHWPVINELGSNWEAESEDGEPIDFDWGSISPSLDVWLQVPDNQLHYVQKILPTLDWDGSAIGVRLRYEPKSPDDFKREYLNARLATKKVMAAALDSDESSEDPFSLWPKSMIEFLSRRLRSVFEVKAYLLDPAMLDDPEDGFANPQALPTDSEPLEGDPFKGLIRIDEISAQRGLGLAASSNADQEDETVQLGKKLSSQLRKYYSQHLDPFDQPEAKDLQALQALHQARVAFGKQLSDSFESALKELETVGYPGLTDPKLKLAADLRPLDALNHGSAVHYEVPTHLAEVGFSNRLPEDSNGLGYQNLVSMVFALMSFRDKWMRVGKASKKTWADDDNIPPLHLVLVEEPEAHLHAQVQQVFIAHAYAVLRKHESLGSLAGYHTQMVVSTHSSHLAHEAEFTSLRYFRRMPVKAIKGSVPISQVVNLSRIFGTQDDTTRFVKRYLKATHCDLFFADGAILVEGPAERIVVPHMVRCRAPYAYLRHCYITWLEIGGSHAHRLRPLLTKLGLNTLIITDLDAKADDGTKAAPARSSGQSSRNQTIKTWAPQEESIDLLLDMPETSLTEMHDSGFGFRVAYQQPVKIDFGAAKNAEAIANTFEDALIYQNIDFFKSLQGGGLAKQIRQSIADSKDVTELSSSIQKALKNGDKAEFSMTLLESSDLDEVALPDYIDKGLLWLIAQLKRKEDDVAGKLPLTPTSPDDAAPATSEVKQ
ncbi:ATP-dependent endonuclease [Xanthomonas arboricola]|uniref:AAA family ATPase n=1 Tax=Xanthomonas arboricola TaxID=56448 RepID=UPI0007ED0623|nr:AAA family ATPase [Xanthomonas arboricola]OBR76414.1 ATP-dependent endonuclease [Xanthomonas arboricola]